MADTTIKVTTDVRDRLAVLAAEQGTTIRDLVDQLAAATPTQAAWAHPHRRLGIVPSCSTTPRCWPWTRAINGSPA